MLDDSRFSECLADENATLDVARRLAGCLRAGLVVYLQGDLGAGKTTLVRGMLRGLGFDGRVKSPTYTLLETYALAGLSVCHFDLYRMNDADEWEAAGFRDEFNGENVFLIEWPQRAAGQLPPVDWEVDLSRDGEGRRLTLTACSELGKLCLKAL